MGAPLQTTAAPRIMLTETAAMGAPLQTTAAPRIMLTETAAMGAPLQTTAAAPRIMLTETAGHGSTAANNGGTAVNADGNGGNGSTAANNGGTAVNADGNGGNGSTAANNGSGPANNADGNGASQQNGNSNQTVDPYEQKAINAQKEIQSLQSSGQPVPPQLEGSAQINSDKYGNIFDPVTNRYRAHQNSGDLPPNDEKS